MVLAIDEFVFSGGQESVELALAIFLTDRVECVAQIWTLNSATFLICIDSALFTFYYTLSESFYSQSKGICLLLQHVNIY
ncbi:hypothetical protein A9237_05430 [Vibrio owensii]|nr:hypothetical protein A9237_05430 [Vibrio owensii]